MKINIETRHIVECGYPPISSGTLNPIAFAVKEELDKLPVPKGYLRVERVVSVSSSVLVTEHRIIKRKGREEIDLAFEKYYFGPKAEFNLNDPAFTWMVDFGFHKPSFPTTIEITRDETYK